MKSESRSSCINAGQIPLCGKRSDKLGGLEKQNRLVCRFAIHAGQQLSIGHGIARSLAGGSMKTALYNLIVISPENTGLNRIHVSRSALMILAAAFVLSFCSTVFLLLTFPRVQLREIDRSQLVHVRHETDIQRQNTYLARNADADRNMSLQSGFINQ